jgi:hypothetical protein
LRKIAPRQQGTHWVPGRRGLLKRAACLRSLAEPHSTVRISSRLLFELHRLQR